MADADNQAYDDTENQGRRNSDGEEVLRKPHDQLSISQKEKEASKTMFLLAKDPNLSDHLVRFDYTESTFDKVDAIDGVKVHFNMTGILVDMDHPDAVKQQLYKKIVDEVAEENKRREAEKTMGFKMVDPSSVDALISGIATGKAPEPEVPEEEPLYPKSVQLKNQFNFSSRATQTYKFNNPMRARALATVPPPHHDLIFDVTRWDIFDSYLKELLDDKAAKAAREKKNTFGGGDKADEKEEVQEVKEEKGLFFSDEFAWAAKLMERMVTLNVEEDKFMEYKSTRRGIVNTQDAKGGNFRVLWKFRYLAMPDNLTVTALTWNHEYTDLFAVGYGSYIFPKDDSKSSGGVVCCFSLKNTSHPEYVFNTESGVMCLDFHPQHHSLLCVGCYDGTVLVFDVRSGNPNPIFSSTDPKTQHTDPVWEVRWQKDEPEKNVNFFSISSDGRVTNWIMNKNELINEEVVELKLAPHNDSGSEEEEFDDDTVVGLAGGSCFDFNDSSSDIFIVGTEEGGLYSYSKAFNSQFLNLYSGHHMAVYRVLWNPFHPQIFLSCSADWSVKLWEYDNYEPVMTFDFTCIVADIAWAPFKSTMFAVGTDDCKVRVFDLQQDKHAPIGETLRLGPNKTKLTHISFNPDMPILTVGFDNGAVSVIKISGLLEGSGVLPRELTEEQREDETLLLDALLIIDDNQGTKVGQDIVRGREERRLKKEKEEAEKNAAAAAEN